MAAATRRDTAEAVSILVRLLGKTDALWMPNREVNNFRANSNYYAEQKHFQTAGVPWASERTDEEGRKESQRQLERLVAAGLVQVSGRKQGRVQRAKFTEAGDEKARQILTLPTWYSGWLSMVKLAELSRRPPKLWTDIWVGELKFRCLKKATEWEEILLTCRMFLPAIWRGLVIAEANAYGRASYSLTEAGWALLDKDQEPVDDDPGGKRKPPPPVLWELYIDTVEAEINRLQTMAPENPREIGWFGLPASMEGEKW